MYSIFYDLETSDSNYIGQILNFAFVAFDSNWQIVDQLTGEVKISRLQLPRAGAILANRINVLEHQDRAQFTEPQALQEISQFLSRMAEKSATLPKLIGFNSAGFDLKYLRTSMIRNGISPYRPKLLHGDMLLLSRHLSITNAEFRKFVAGNQSEKYSLSLERLCQRFELLSGKQQHESLADVMLTAKLAQIYIDRFAIDIRTFEGYQAEAGLEPGQAVFRLETDYSMDTSERVKETAYMFLAEDRNCSLWVDLARFSRGQGVKSIVYRRKQCGELVLRFGHVDQALESLRVEAYDQLKSINCNNYFKPSTCDIEQDIYRLDFDGIDALVDAIWNGNLKLLQNASKKSRDARILYLRQQLNNYHWGSGDDKKIRQDLKSYFDYRYAGKLQLAMFLDAESEKESNGDFKYERFHPTYADMQKEIKTGLEMDNAQNQALLQALSQFYLASDMKP